MSKRINLAKLTKKLDDKKDKEGSKVVASSNTGVVIREKWPWDEVPDLSPNKRGQIDDSKGKEALLPSKAKKSKSIKTENRVFV